MNPEFTTVTELAGDEAPVEQVKVGSLFQYEISLKG